MPATPARHPPDVPERSRPRQRTSATLDRRRRSQHFARRRRDLVEDIAAALVVTLITVTFTAGLGVIALIEVPLALALISSYLLERRVHRRRNSRRPRRPTRA